MPLRSPKFIAMIRPACIWQYARRLLLWSCVALPWWYGPSLAQTTTQNQPIAPSNSEVSQPESKNGATSKPKQPDVIPESPPDIDKKKKVDLTPAQKKQKEEQEELDKSLLGPWVLISTVDAKPGMAEIETAAPRCVERPQIKKLAIEPGATRKLPAKNELFGDLVYFRTAKGLQRFHIPSGEITLIREVRKNLLSGNRTVWALRGRAVRLRIRFSVPRKNIRAEFMIEEGGFYLRCRRPSPPKETLQKP